MIKTRKQYVLCHKTLDIMIADFMDRNPEVNMFKMSIMDFLNWISEQTNKYTDDPCTGMTTCPCPNCPASRGIEEYHL